MQHYVGGFLFDSVGHSVGLVYKHKPSWQAHHFNCIGGKIEDGETPLQAMIREAQEEAGVTVDWEFATTVTSSAFECHFFRAFSDDLYKIKTMESEPVVIIPFFNLPGNMVDNCKWLIPMLRERHLDIPPLFQYKS